jgi:putative DNA primase/helicase
MPKRRTVTTKSYLRWIAKKVTLYRSPDRSCYAEITPYNYREIVAIDSERFATYLHGLCYDHFGKMPNATQFRELLQLIKHKALNLANEMDVHKRVAIYNEVVYIDLADNLGSTIKITREGYNVIFNPPVLFIRNDGMLPLPLPKKSTNAFRRLQRIVPLKGDDFKLFVTFLITSLVPPGPYPILVLQGEQGTGKSYLSKLIKRLIDPSKAPIRALPKNTEDLLIAARNTWLLCFDNITGLKPWQSDLLCCLATNAGWTTRKHYNNLEEVYVEVCRPVVLNGIGDFITRNDLADRVILLNLPVMDKSKRQPEYVLNRKYQHVHPYVLGAVANAISVALRDIKDIEIDGYARMADFTRWGAAMAPAVGWSKSRFLKAYDRNRKRMSFLYFETDLVASAVVAFVESRARSELPWTGTATKLLSLLAKEVDHELRHSRNWPKAANVLAGRLRLAAPSLREKGIQVKFLRSGGERKVKISLLP